MDPIDHRHAEWQHALHGHPAPPPQPKLIAPAILLAAGVTLPWLPTLLEMIW